MLDKLQSTQHLDCWACNSNKGTKGHMGSKTRCISTIRQLQMLWVRLWLLIGIVAMSQLSLYGLLFVVASLTDKTLSASKTILGVGSARS